MKVVFVIAAIFIFGFLIAIHELGHFLAARLCGVSMNSPSVWAPASGIKKRKKPSIPFVFYLLVVSVLWMGRMRILGMNDAWPVKASGKNS